MKKKIVAPILVLICFFLYACRNQESYRFLNSTDEISEISIVTVSFSENADLIQTEIRKIQDVNLFLEEFRRVDCYSYYGDPVGIFEEGATDTVIKILYENDEYELINWRGQTEYTIERGFRFYAGYNVFDENQFKSLIKKYSSQGIQ